MHTANDLFLVIDQGGHASRAIVFDATGKQVTKTEHVITTKHSEDHFVEHDPLEVLNSIRTCLQQTATKLGTKASQIVAIGMATQRSNMICWDKISNVPLSPIISWQDTRAHEYLASLQLDREQLHEKTGLFPSAHYGASKIHWCLQHIPEVKQAFNDSRLCCAPMSTYLACQLTQEKHRYCDPVSASRTLLWNIANNDWDSDLLNTFDIPIEVLPQCVPTRYEYGHIDFGGQQIPLRIVTGDQSAALYAFGDLQYETAYVNIGTGAFISRPSNAIVHARRLLTSVIRSDNNSNHYVLEGTINGAGSAINWLRDQCPVSNLWEQLPDWLAQISNPPLFLNGVSGLAAPYWVADFETDMLDEQTADIEAKYVAVVESIVFLLFANVQEMNKFASAPQQLQITGGLSRLDGLCQRLADLSRMPIYRPGESEATARGTAYLLSNKSGRWEEQEHGHWFQPQKNAALDQRFLLWENAMLHRMRKGQD